MELYWESIFGHHDVQDIIPVYVGFVYIVINLLFLINSIFILSINPIILSSISITDYFELFVVPKMCCEQYWHY